jgi:hypothetical protein
MDPRLVSLYRQCRQAVLDAGFADEVTYYQTRDLDAVTESEFLCELAWVIVNSGMRNTVCRRLWPALRRVFREFDSAARIVADRDEIRPGALGILNHPGKIDAILSAAGRVHHQTWPAVQTEIQREGIAALRRFRYIGPALCYHLGKNLGLPVAKPDRHLLRIAAAVGYKQRVQVLCEDLAAASGDLIGVVDYVLWSYAVNVNPEYLARFLERR